MDIEQLHFKFYEVGGKVRDELLGLCSKDVDYVAVPDESIRKCNTTETLFKALELYLRKENFEIFLITPSCFTIRARFPQNYKYSGVADFVLSRKEEYYIEGTRRPVVVPGTLYDDLSRRDFTVNALARDPDTGEVIDYFNGQDDLKYKTFFETLYYVRGAKNIYAMMSSNRDNIKDKEYLGKDTLVLIMNHDSKNNLKLENKKTRELNKVYNDLEFLYIVQFSERFYDVYRVR